MDNSETLPGLVGRVLDFLTTGYRWAYRSAIGPDGVSPSMEAPATWFIGTLGTMVVLVLLALVWDAVFLALRWRGRLLLDSATQGLSLRQASTLVDHFVRLDHLAGLIQRLSRVKRVSTNRNSPDTFTKRTKGSRMAALPFLVSMIIPLGIAVARLLLTTVGGLLTLVGTWWAMGGAGLDRVRGAVERWTSSGSVHMTALDISALGVALAALTFALSRLRGASAAGHQAWRRDESAQASDELADREVAIDAFLAVLNHAEESVHSNLGSMLVDFRNRAERNSIDREQELCRLLDLPEPPTSKREWLPPDARIGLASPRDPAVTEVVEALERLKKTLSKVTDRSEVRVRRSAPWRVVRRASSARLCLAIDDVARYVDVRVESDVQLTDARSHAFRLTARSKNTYVRGPRLDAIDFGMIPDTDRFAAVAGAKEEWRCEVERAARRLERHAHETLIKGLVGIAELEAARNAIAAYIHPAGPTTKLRDWLRPA